VLVFEGEVMDGGSILLGINFKKLSKNNGGTDVIGGPILNKVPSFLYWGNLLWITVKATDTFIFCDNCSSISQGESFGTS
jgi:hypothetical protein